MKSRLDYNIHSHTRRCGHAVGEDYEYIDAAIEAGIKQLGFSDHIMLLAFPRKAFAETIVNSANTSPRSTTSRTSTKAKSISASALRPNGMATSSKTITVICVPVLTWIT